MQQDARSKWAVPLMLAPYAAPLIRRLANAFPDHNLTQHIKVHAGRGQRHPAACKMVTGTIMMACMHAWMAPSSPVLPAPGTAERRRESQGRPLLRWIGLPHAAQCQQRLLPMQCLRPVPLTITITITIIITAYIKLCGL